MITTNMQNFIIEANDIALRGLRSHADNVTKLVALKHIDNMNSFDSASKLYMSNLKHLLSGITHG